MLNYIDSKTPIMKAVHGFYQEESCRAKIVEVYSEGHETESGEDKSEEEDPNYKQRVYLTVPRMQRKGKVPTVQAADRTILSTRTARKEVLDGVYPLPREKSRQAPVKDLQAPQGVTRTDPPESAPKAATPKVNIPEVTPIDAQKVRFELPELEDVEMEDPRGDRPPSKAPQKEMDLTKKSISQRAKEDIAQGIGRQPPDAELGLDSPDIAIQRTVTMQWDNYMHHRPLDTPSSASAIWPLEAPYPADVRIREAMGNPPPLGQTAHLPARYDPTIPMLPATTADHAALATEENFHSPGILVHAASALPDSIHLTDRNDTNSQRSSTPSSLPDLESVPSSAPSNSGAGCSCTLDKPCPGCLEPTRANMNKEPLDENKAGAGDMATNSTDTTPRLAQLQLGYTPVIDSSATLFANLLMHHFQILCNQVVVHNLQQILGLDPSQPENLVKLRDIAHLAEMQAHEAYESFSQHLAELSERFLHDPQRGSRSPSPAFSLGMGIQRAEEENQNERSEPHTATADLPTTLTLDSGAPIRPLSAATGCPPEFQYHDSSDRQLGEDIYRWVEHQMERQDQTRRWDMDFGGEPWQDACATAYGPLHSYLDIPRMAADNLRELTRDVAAYTDRYGILPSNHTRPITPISDTDPNPTQSPTSLDFSLLHDDQVPSPLPSSSAPINSDAAGVETSNERTEKRKSATSGMSAAEKPPTQLAHPGVIEKLAAVRRGLLEGRRVEDILVREKSDFQEARHKFYQENEWVYDSSLDIQPHAVCRRLHHALLFDFEAAKLQVLLITLRQWHYTKLVWVLNDLLRLRFRDEYTIANLLGANFLDLFAPASPDFWGDLSSGLSTDSSPSMEGVDSGPISFYPTTSRPASPSEEEASAVSNSEGSPILPTTALTIAHHDTDPTPAPSEVFSVFHNDADSVYPSDDAESMDANTDPRSPQHVLFNVRPGFLETCRHSRSDVASAN
ncbi:hypothetical protein FB451DRAFT_1173671 [Mycena latifolia]|nr:hypothetical protein FB451DRAFT_1173671 [Mycena latifolia]